MGRSFGPGIVYKELHWFVPSFFLKFYLRSFERFSSSRRKYESEGVGYRSRHVYVTGILESYGSVCAGKKLHYCWNGIYNGLRQCISGL